MAGVGKLIKQAQKMQTQIAQAQAALGAQKIDVSAGGGAVKLTVNGAGEFLSLSLDTEFLREDASLVAETILGAVRDGAAKAKEANEAVMRKATQGFSMPGLM
ncbi:hypothetical protein ASA1KI_27800 [Opitutales bacterium ASA1]|uniref:YbaB/EbfC family nucleoid-associated protein n=1 Tax=Congregicoccus parvus TaxID=3081749 RepID=UPI002B27CCB3|nr:hypothetical protein ASA1KI_27800 [Opitutales bacterium ASA1]